MIYRVVLLIAIMIVVSSQIASAQYQYSFNYESNGGIKTIFETSDDANIGIDGGDVLWDSAMISQMNDSINLGIYKETGQEGWNSDPGFLVREMRPTLHAGETAVIREIYLWAGAAVQPIDYLELNILQPAQMAQGLSYRLMLMSIPDSVTYKGPTEWGPEDTGIRLPFYSTNDGTTGYRFHAVITAVPEPSSVVALMSALACTGTMALKRRIGKGRTI